MMSNVTEDEVEIVEVVNSILTLAGSFNKAAPLLIRMLHNLGTPRLDPKKN